MPHEANALHPIVDELWVECRSQMSALPTKNRINTNVRLIEVIEIED